MELLKKIYFLILYNVLLANANNIGNLDLVELNSEQMPMENVFFKNKHIVLVFFNEDLKAQSPDPRIYNELKAHLEELNKSTSQQQIEIHAVRNTKFANKIGISKYPQLAYFRDGNFVRFKRKYTAENLSNWVEETVEKKTFRLDDSSFEHDTQATSGATTGDWLVLFHPEKCLFKLTIEPNWEMAAIKLENQVNLAYVNIDKSPLLEKRFHLYEPNPLVLFFTKGKMYRYELAKYDTDSLVSFSQNFYKNMKSEKIPREILWFDHFTDDVVKSLKEMNQNYVYGIFGGIVFICLLATCWTCKRLEKPVDKKEKEKAKLF